MRTDLTLNLLCVLGVGALGAAGCAAANPVAGELPYEKVDPSKADSSAEAVFVELSFDGELETDRGWDPSQQVEDQLLYTIGQLNGVRGVGRLDSLALTDVETESIDDGRYRIRYHAQLPVAWGRRDNVPSEFTLRMPRDVSYEALTRFAETYGHDCVDFGAHDVDSGSMWYYYRPDAFGCTLDDADVVDMVATVTPSALQTTGRFPEYDRVWAAEEDGARVFRVVAVMGKFEDGATSNSDAGIRAYNRFIELVHARLGTFGEVSTIPSDLPQSPGVAQPDVSLSVQIDTERRVEVVALLVDNVRTAGRSFDARYGALSSQADLLIYSGHAGLGANIRAMARKGRWVQGQYAVVFMNGCDTYAYVDRALWDAHAAVNPDDPNGTIHTDIVMNALPASAFAAPNAIMALVDGLLSYDAPLTYEQIFTRIDRSQVVLVSGEQDNTFTPGGGGDPDPAWTGMMHDGAVSRGDELRFETPVLPPGAYRLEITGDGDADLYVRIGEAPSAQAYDCRPYRSDSNEVCDVTLPSASALHVMVRGYRDATFTLVGAARD